MIPFVILKRESVQPFILTIDTEEVGTTGINQFRFPAFGDYYVVAHKHGGGVENFPVMNGDNTLTFSEGVGVYDIEIYPIGTNGFDRIEFYSRYDYLKVLDIKQWGGIVWNANQTGAFWGCANMTCTATDSPDFSLLEIGQGMFDGCVLFNPVNFDSGLSNLVQAINMFRFCSSFNPPNYAPTLENLTSGSSMYNGCSSFNPPNYAPTLENLTNGGYMYLNCSVFNPPSYAPTLDALTSGSHMFYQAYIPIDFYLTSTTHLEDIQAMFAVTNVNKITLNCISVISTRQDTFQSPDLTDLILTDMSISFHIHQSPSLLGSKIDDLAQSVADLTGGATMNVTMTNAQYTSGIDPSIWTNKNWTIVVV